MEKPATRRPIRSSGATQSSRNLDPLKEFLRQTPALLEPGLRIVDTDLEAGDRSAIDLVGVDRDGALVILDLAAGDADAALRRLLDHYLWARGARGLLGRVYSHSGCEIHRLPRCMLVAPAFEAAFLQRLALVSLPIRAFVARPIPAETASFLVEPAEALYGRPVADPGATWRDEPGLEPWPATLETEPAMDPRPFGPDDPIARELMTPDAAPRDIEPLTAEELEEFGRFEDLPRARDGAS